MENCSDWGCFKTVNWAATLLQKSENDHNGSIKFTSNENGATIKTMLPKN